MGPVMTLREVRNSLVGVPRPLPAALAVRGVAGAGALRACALPPLLPRYPICTIAPESAKQQQAHLIPQSEGAAKLLGEAPVTKAIRPPARMRTRVS